MFSDLSHWRSIERWATANTLSPFWVRERSTSLKFVGTFKLMWRYDARHSLHKSISVPVSGLQRSLIFSGAPFTYTFSNCGLSSVLASTHIRYRCWHSAYIIALFFSHGMHFHIPEAQRKRGTVSWCLLPSPQDHWWEVASLQPEPKGQTLWDHFLAHKCSIDKRGKKLVCKQGSWPSKPYRQWVKLQGELGRMETYGQEATAKVKTN